MSNAMAMSAPSVPAIELRDITKQYGDVKILDRVSLDVPEHSITCLIGASGCGKSTLLRCVTGLETIDSGDIVLAGDFISGEGVDLNHVRTQVGFVFQSYNLFPNMTILENVMLAPMEVLKWSKADAYERARELLARVGLSGREDSYPHRLSGGQQQRVAIVRALAMDPKVLLLDEITSALDPELVGEVLTLVRELADAGMTMILATHEMAFAKEVADQVCFLSESTIYESGTAAEVLGQPQRERTQAFLKRIVDAGRM
ncbi:amino acid ABC transporter ATP-binding protein [Streptomyces arenae]|uniref:amino acid ABC transporter ATP-binding protein n=1 Tax=Streptomyces arenae TaxID=29301 RepID=UPI002658DE35|nr:amino acid ABC transporter ATP-binding protein [Streptomyces arenae]MCG7207441.1 amino acid ABC transporter ATP-binding protein [Streptomyces arenae]